MTTHLENLARRVEEDPFFLACPLKLFAKSEGLDEEGLARALGCSQETLVMLRLCRVPGIAADDFQRDIDRIVSRFRVHPDVVAEAVRRGQAILHMGGPGAKMGGTLLAARDAEDDRADDKQPGGKS